MSTPVDGQAEIARMDQELSRGINDLLSKGDATPPTEPPDPEPQKEQQAAAEPAPPPSETKPEEVQPEPAPVPESQDTGLPPEVKTLLEQHGGNAVAALQALLTKPEPAKAEPQLPEITEEQIANEVVAYAKVDPECVKLRAEHAPRFTRLNEIKTTYPNLDFDINYLQKRIQEPDLKENIEEEEKLRNQLRDLRDVRAERATLDREIKWLNEDWDKRTGMIESQIRSKVAETYEERIRTAEKEARISALESDFAKKWPVALQSAMQSVGIPKESEKDFLQEAKMALALLVHTGGHVEDVPAFMTKQAQEFKEKQLRFHHAQSVVYGKQKLNTATGAPVSPTPPSSPGAPPPENLSGRQLLQHLDREDDKRALEYFGQGLR